MLKLEKARVTELEGQIKQMSGQVEQHEMALQQQMEQQRLRWKSEIVSSNSMLNTVSPHIYRVPETTRLGCWHILMERSVRRKYRHHVTLRSTVRCFYLLLAHALDFDYSNFL